MNKQKTIFDVLKINTKAKGLFRRRISRDEYGAIVGYKDAKPIAEKAAKALGLHIGIVGDEDAYHSQNADLYAIDLDNGLILVQYREKDCLGRYPKLEKTYFLAFAEADDKVRGLRIPDGRKILPAVKKARSRVLLAREEQLRAGITAALRSRFPEVNERQADDLQLIGGLLFFPMSFRPVPADAGSPSDVFTVTRRKEQGGFFECLSP